MKKIFLLLLLILCTFKSYSQYTLGADKFWMWYHGTLPGSASVGQFYRNSTGDTVYLRTPSGWQVWFPASGSSGVGTVTSFTADPFDSVFTVTVTNSTTTPNLAFNKVQFPSHTWYGNPTGSTADPNPRSIGQADLPSNLVADSSRISLTSKSSDSLHNIRQEVWQRSASLAEASLVNIADEVTVGERSHNGYFPGKIQIKATDAIPAIIVKGDSGASQNQVYFDLQGQNEDYYRIQHYAGATTANKLRVSYLDMPGATQPLYWEFSGTTGMAINGTAYDLFHVFGNTTIGNAATSQSGSGNLRVVGQIQVGSTETAKVYNNLGAAAPDLLRIASVATTDSSSGTNEMAISARNIFTSSSANTMLTQTISWNCVFGYDLWLTGMPVTSTDSGYFQKHIALTCVNNAGTILFDTTTIFYHYKSVPMATCDLTVSVSGNTLTISAKGSATQQTNMLLTGWKRINHQ